MEYGFKSTGKFFDELVKIVEENQGRGIMQLDYISFEPSLYPHKARLIGMLAERVKEQNRK